MQWLTTPPWHAGRAKPFFKQVCKRLVAIGDPRGRTTLGAARKAIPKVVKGASMRGWFTEQIDRTLAALEQARDATPLSSADAKLAARAGKALANQPAPQRKQSRRTQAASELLEAIRANPTDDGARQVYADVLTEQGDPRGAFITMQLARAGQPPTAARAKQELQLLFTHARIWLGELAAVIGGLSRHALAVGPSRLTERRSSPWRASLRFDRGFLAGCRLRGSRAKIAAIAGHPELATVEELALDEHGHLVLAASELPALDELAIASEQVDLLIARPAGARVTTLTLYEGDAGFVDHIVACAKLPALRTLRLQTRSNRFTDEARAAIGAALALRQLRRLETHVCIGDGDGAYVRGQTWTFEPSRKLRAAAVAGFRSVI